MKFQDLTKDLGPMPRPDNAMCDVARNLSKHVDPMDLDSDLDSYSDSDGDFERGEGEEIEWSNRIDVGEDYFDVNSLILQKMLSSDDHSNGPSQQTHSSTQRGPAVDVDSSSEESDDDWDSFW